MSVATPIQFSIEKSLDSGLDGFVTKVNAVVVLREPEGSAGVVGFSLTVIHLGAAMSCGLDGRALYDHFEHGDLLNKVIDSRGYLKALGPWDKPVNLDVAILSGLRVPECAKGESIAVNAILESVRSFAGACGYVLMTEPDAGAPFRVSVLMREKGMFDALPGLLALALDYTSTQMPQSLSAPNQRRLNS